MAFLPFERLIIKTHLNPEEARQKLSEVLESRVFVWRYPPDHRPYRGKINGYDFEISRIIHHRNSFLPKIKGEIQPGIGETLIKVTMMLHPEVQVFMSIFLGFSAFIFLLMLFAWIFSIGTFHGPVILAILGPAGLFTIGYVFCTVAFKFEVGESRLFLRNLFEAHQEEEYSLFKRDVLQK